MVDIKSRSAPIHLRDVHMLTCSFTDKRFSLITAALFQTEAAAKRALALDGADM